MEEGSVILPVASMVTDFLKLCQLGDLKGINALVYPVNLFLHAQMMKMQIQNRMLKESRRSTLMLSMKKI